MKEIVLLLLVLYEKLGGNKDLVNYILKIKINSDIRNKSKEFWIENNFYNWLTNDIVIRNTIEKIDTNFIDYQSYQEYYKLYNSILGLNLENNEYRRTKSINDCFNSKWWKCTEKSSIKWRDVHRIIKSKINVYEIDISQVFQETRIDYYFRNNLLHEVLNIKRLRYINNLYNYFIKQGDLFFDSITNIYCDPMGIYEIQFYE